MQTLRDEFVNVIAKRLEENSKSFRLLYGIKHYGNCISILCQELDQYIRLLFLVKQNENIKDQLINDSIHDEKWYYITSNGKKIHITDKDIEDFIQTLDGWNKEICKFRRVFYKVTVNYNYLQKDPIKGLDNDEKEEVYLYIKEYHNKVFPKEYKLEDVVKELDGVFKKISKSIRIELEGI